MECMWKCMWYEYKCIWVNDLYSDVYDRWDTCYGMVSWYTYEYKLYCNVYERWDTWMILYNDMVYE